MPLSYHEMVAQAKRQIREISTTDLATTSPGRVLIDIREPVEFAAGTIPGAALVPRGLLAGAIARLAPDSATEIVLLCAVGNRSALAAKELQDMGYRNVASLAGGYGRWLAEGRATVLPEVGDEFAVRYARHLVLPGIGPEGQAKLRSARVLLVGAGGLGSPVALYLGAAGVGLLRIVDDDLVDLGNLQRQIAHDTDRIGVAKAESAAISVHRLNPEVRVEAHPIRLAAANVLELAEGVDLIVDAADNFPTRYLLNDAALRLRVPVVHGSVFRWEGRVTVFAPYEGPCHRCLYPLPPPPELAPDCAVAGVLGAQTGVVGSLLAVEAVKLITGAGIPLVGRLQIHDALTQEVTTVRITRDPGCAACSDQDHPPALVDYDAACRPR